MAHIPTASYPICPLCAEHVELESANTDDKGKAVHEECYVTHATEQARIQVEAPAWTFLTAQPPKSSTH